MVAGKCTLSLVLLVLIFHGRDHEQRVHLLPRDSIERCRNTCVVVNQLQSLLIEDENVGSPPLRNRRATRCNHKKKSMRTHIVATPELFAVRQALRQVRDVTGNGRLLVCFTMPLAVAVAH